MKRKADDAGVASRKTSNGRNKRAATNGTSSPTDNEIRSRFGSEVFLSDKIKQHTESYASSAPYKHAVISDLISDPLLRAVRSEILTNIHFTPKETDIYRIHQSGDLANLDGLDPAALKQLPSLLKLRDALYSPDFRSWISTVSGAGALSGTKTDMAVNVYVPGCHLLCHDDVIGSRRVSYILYLTDPDIPWQASWGGALRLYSTDERRDGKGRLFRFPRAEWSKVIPPAWNQLSFFAVQPGESFHDVEEVYDRTDGDDTNDGGRWRIAISGWFHIPQPGEEGYEPGLEQRLAEKSSLQQLQGKAEEFDEPQLPLLEPVNVTLSETADPMDADDGDVELTESDLAFLLQFLTPNYLTPDTAEELQAIFAEESTLQLANFLNAKFALAVKDQLEELDSQHTNNLDFHTSRPPHKHRYQYMHSKTLQSQLSTSPQHATPLERLIEQLFPSKAFSKWLSVATGLDLASTSAVIRRFRKGLDYQLGEAYGGDNPQLEYCLGITPSPGWGADDHVDTPAEAENGHAEGELKPKAASHEHPTERDEASNVGGYELYMAGDEEDEEEEGGGADAGVDASAAANAGEGSSATGAGARRPAGKPRRAADDPAVYRASSNGEADEDDGILMSTPASWNTLTVVLRDRGVLRFVKYVSQSAKGDRWDVSGRYEVLDGDDDSDEDDGPAKDGASSDDEDEASVAHDDRETEWQGFE